MLTWTIVITHAFFVLFEFHETTHRKFKVKCNVMFFIHINVFEMIMLYYY